MIDPGLENYVCALSFRGRRPYSHFYQDCKQPTIQNGTILRVDRFSDYLAFVESDIIRITCYNGKIY